MVLREERKGLEKKFYDLCFNVVAEQGLALYDMDFLAGSGELRIFIYNADTQTAVIEDCIKIDHALTPFFETESWIPENLSLEVSSPGIFRTLKSVEHFKMAIGEKVAVALRQKISEDQFPGVPKKLTKDKKIVVLLRDADEKSLRFEWEDFSFVIPYEDIKKANVEKDI